MSTKIFSNNSHIKNTTTSKKSNQYSNSNLNKEKQKIKNETNLSNSKKGLKDNSYNNITTSKNNEITFTKDKSTNKFISISEFPETDKENTYDTFNYINIIHSSVFNNNNINSNCDKEKLKFVNANSYLDKEKNQISSFNDFKQQLYNKNYKNNTSFIFNRNSIEINDMQKIEKEKNYQIKRYRYLKLYRYSFNPIIRQKNAEIIQIWWRKKIVPKIDKIKKIIKIQSIYRGYITRKNLNDIIYIFLIYQNFINKLRHVLGNFVHRNYFPKRYYKKKYAIEKILPLKLKIYIRKWNAIAQCLNRQNKAIKLLVKNMENKKYYLLVMKTFIKIWKLKCEHFAKNEDKIICLKNQNNKYCALPKLINTIEKFAKRNAYYLIKEKLSKYLIYSFRNKYIKKIINIYEKNKIKCCLKKYFYKWRLQSLRDKEKSLKETIFKNEIKTHIKKSNNELLRSKLNIFRERINLININELKRAKKEFLFPEGAKHITNCIRRYIIRLIFKENIRKKNIQKKLLKIICNSFMKYALNKWKNTTNKLSRKDKSKICLKKLITKTNRVENFKKCSKSFNKWKNTALINKFKAQKINIYAKFCNSLEKYVMSKNKNIVRSKKIFMTKKLNKYINNNSIIIRKKLSQRLKNYEKRNKFMKLTKYFNKWKKFVEYCKLNDLKAKNLETVSRLTKVLYNSKKLSHNLYEWKIKNTLIGLNNKNKFKDNVNNIMKYLIKIKNKRMKLFFDCLIEAKYKIMKKLILKILITKYSKNLLLKYFNKYKFKAYKLKNSNEFTRLNKYNKLKNVLNKIIQKIDKKEYGLLKKCLYKWYLLSKLINIENYKNFLLKIKTSTELINSFIINNYLRNPFNKLKTSKINTKNNLLQKLKKYFYRNDKDVLRKFFHKFSKNTQYKDNNIIKSKIIYNLKLKFEQIKNKSLMSKYFNKWKILNKIYINQRNNNITFLTNCINQIINRRNQKKFINKIKRIKFKYNIKYLSKLLFDVYTKVKYRTLYKHLKKWRNNASKLRTIENQRDKGSKIIYKTLSKVYAYKKLQNSLIPLIIYNYKKRYYKEFINRFRQLFLTKIKYNYKCLIKSNIVPKKYHFKFKKTIRPNTFKTNNDIINEKENERRRLEELSSSNKKHRKSRYIYRSKIRNLNSYLLKEKDEDEEIPKNIIISKSTKNDKMYIEFIIPYLIDYLNEIRLKRLRLVFAQFIYIKKNNLFCTLLKSFTKKQIYPNKKNLLKTLHQSCIKQNLYLSIRKNVIHKITTKYLDKVKKRKDLLSIVNQTFKYKKINKYKNAIKILRVWKIYIKILKSKASALKKFEKNFIQTYEKISDSMFMDNDNDKEKSVQTQVYNFLDKLNSNDKNNLGFIQSSWNKSFCGEMTESIDISNNSNLAFNDYNESNVTVRRFYKFNKDSYSNYKGSNMNKNSGRKIASTVFNTKKNK